MPTAPPTEPSTGPSTGPSTAPPCPTVAVVLAAGGGSRFRGASHKLTAQLDGTPLATRAIDSAARAAIGPVVVVTGAIRPELPSGPLPVAVIEVDHPDWAAGQATSLRAGIERARSLGAEAVVVGLADQPFVEPGAWRAVAASTSPIAFATYDGTRGNPVRLHSSVWSLLPDHGDEGARALIRVRPELAEPIPCPGSAADIDTLEDLQRWQNSSSTNSP